MQCCAPANCSPGRLLPPDYELDSAYGVTRRPCRDVGWSIPQRTLHHELRLGACVTNIGRTVPRSPMMRRLMPTAKTTMPRQTTSTHQKALANPAIRRRPVLGCSQTVLDDRVWVFGAGGQDGIWCVHAALPVGEPSTGEVGRGAPADRVPPSDTLGPMTNMPLRRSRCSRATRSDTTFATTPRS